ncbi:Clavaminate synthase-like protein [Glonium stellatum]|uniref:Clavaminate synthase-like protein n=1 Tax=Glonium stellatum TaxID=574774 RepID=A0A8E2ENK4_9PEZI|nr:Clavaminate synthase-like protein [Glonium stellatum]
MATSINSQASHIIRRSYTTASQFRPVKFLESFTVEAFRTDYFTTDTPVLLRNHFRSIPAISSWFRPSPNGHDSQELNTTYFAPHASTTVPLEITRLPLSASSSQQSHLAAEEFERIRAPLSLFLTFISQSSTPTIRLYLAQCALDSLPQSLQSDLPTPELVLKVGKGDVYATSLWLGRPPTRTPLHRDPNPNIFVQLAGKKLVRLMEPHMGRAVYERVTARGGHANMRGEEMMVGDEMRGLEEAVWGGMGNEVGWEARLESGDGLFIPKGWWHSVRGVGEGVTGSANWWFR